MYNKHPHMKVRLFCHVSSKRSNCISYFAPTYVFHSTVYVKYKLQKHISSQMGWLHNDLSLADKEMRRTLSL